MRVEIKKECQMSYSHWKKLKLNFIFALLSVIVFTAILCACSKQETGASKSIVFKGEQKANVIGYTDHLMEPFLSRDGKIILFNNSNNASVNTNLHWAVRVDDINFEYKGEVTGVNTPKLEGVPTMDKDGVFYFVSTRDYDQTLASIYQSNFSNGTATNVTQTSGLSKNQAGWLNFDVEVSADGQYLYFVDGRFDQLGGPYEADIVIAKKNNNAFQRLVNSNEILKNINTDQLEYAACISANDLELYFTRLELPISATSAPQIFVSSRNTPNVSFGTPLKIESISGFVEAPTISPDGKTLYYHKKEVDGKYALYLTKRVE